MRLFTAIEVPDALRQRLARVAPALVEGRWGLDARLLHVTFTRSENLHVTLKFLGEVAEQDVPAICDVLAAVPRPGVLPLNIDGGEMFPARGPVRIIAAKVGGAAERLVDLEAAIEDACAPLGIPRDGRPYRPHVTLARCKRGLPTHFRSSVQDVARGLSRDGGWIADAFVLMESRLH